MLFHINAFYCVEIYRNHHVIVFLYWNCIVSVLVLRNLLHSTIYLVKSKYAHSF